MEISKKSGILSDILKKFRKIRAGNKAAGQESGSVVIPGPDG
jgi:hypothetical protein